jgi:hypothetical protein
VRLIKMLGLAATAALAVMAFVGSSSAMGEGATWLCKNETGTCSQVTHVHFLSVVKNASNEHVDGRGKLVGGGITVECQLLVLGEVISNGTNPAKIKSKLHYTDCTNGCEVTGLNGELEIPGVIDVLRLGTGQLADVTGLEFEVKLRCPFVFTCDYNAEGLTGHGSPLNNVAGNIPHVTYTNATVNLTSKLAGPFNCPSTGALTALLKSLELFYIRSVG